MPTKKQKERMMDYLADALEKGGHEVRPNSVRTSGERYDTNYIKTEDGLILLLDDPRLYTKNKTARIINGIIDNCIENYAAVFYKDGSGFFRNHASESNAIQGKFSKLSEDRSLKKYSAEDLHNSIILTEAERLVNRRKKVLQYYQPESERLSEMLVSYSTEPFIFNYSHIHPNKRYGPIEKPSEKLVRITKKWEDDGALTLHDGHLEEFVKLEQLELFS